MGLLDTNIRFTANPITNNNIRIDAVSGTLTKTFRDSYFVRFQKGSKMEDFYFGEEKVATTYGSRRKIVVLQVMLAFDSNYVVEVIDKEDYDKLFDS